MFFKQILQREFKKVIAFLSLLIKIRQFIGNKTMVFANDSIRIKKTHVHTCNIYRFCFFILLKVV